MIASIVAAFLAGVFATLGGLFFYELRDEARRRLARAPRPWRTVTSAQGSTEITFRTREAPLGGLCGDLLRLASTDRSLTTGPTMDQRIEPQRYRVFVSWRMTFTANPDGEEPRT